MASINAALGPEQDVLGHPRGLYVCFLTEMWERFSFYGMKALLIFYLTKYHLFADADGYLLLGTYGGLAYALPVLGGLVADRWLGMRKAVVFGAVLLCLGHFGMAFEGEQARMVDGVVVRDAGALEVFYLSLALIIVGVGFLKPNISTIVGRLYGDADPRRDSGFTVFYMGINVGAVAASLICGWLGETFGWGYGFGAAGVGMLLGLLVFVTGQKHFHGRAESPVPQALAERVAGVSREWWIYVAGLVGVAGIWQLLQLKLSFLDAVHLTATEAVALVLASVLLAWFVWYTLARLSAVDRGRMWTLMVLIAVSALFWAIYEQSYSSWNTFADRAMNRDALGISWTASQLTFLPAFFVIVLSPLFAWLWPRLDRARLNPSTPIKFALALAFAGLAMGVLAYSAQHPEANGLTSIWLFVLAYFVLVLGEMLLSPIGLSAVTALSVARVVSLMMGVWFLASAFGEMLAGRLATLAAIETDAGSVADVASALPVYANLFSLLLWIGLGAGLAMLAISPLLHRLMRRDSPNPVRA